MINHKLHQVTQPLLKLLFLPAAEICQRANNIRMGVHFWSFLCLREHQLDDHHRQKDAIPSVFVPVLQQLVPAEDFIWSTAELPQILRHRLMVDSQIAGQMGEELFGGANAEEVRQIQNGGAKLGNLPVDETHLGWGFDLVVLMGKMFVFTPNLGVSTMGPLHEFGCNFCYSKYVQN